jgi:hypothetical protein
MSATVNAAIIAGVCTVLAPVLTLFVKSWLGQRHFFPISDERRRAVVGRWSGSVHQIIGPQDKPIDFDINVEFTARYKLVTGVGRFINSQGHETVIESSGGFIDNHFLKCEYKDRDPSVIRYGSFVLKLSDNAEHMEGRFVAYAAETEGLVYGDITLHKK